MQLSSASALAMKKLKAKFKNLKETILDPQLKALMEEGMAV